jgi:hypothetical protein
MCSSLNFIACLSSKGTEELRYNFVPHAGGSNIWVEEDFH